MKIFLPFLFFLFLASCDSSRNDFQDTSTGETPIKYQSTENVSQSGFLSFVWDDSFVEQVWYNENSQEMVVQLKNTKYKYCGVESTVYENFKNADSLWKFYRQYLYQSEKYDCRE